MTFNLIKISPEKINFNLYFTFIKVIQFKLSLINLFTLTIEKNKNFIGNISKVSREKRVSKPPIHVFLSLIRNYGSQRYYFSLIMRI